MSLQSPSRPRITRAIFIRGASSSHGQGANEEVLAAFRAAPRIAFIRMSDGMAALNSTVELMLDLGRPRGDLWEVALWEDGLTVEGNEAYYTYQVFNQAIVVPETIHAIRALTGSEQNGERSIRQTDEALGIASDFPAVRGEGTGFSKQNSMRSKP